MLVQKYRWFGRYWFIGAFVALIAGPSAAQHPHHSKYAGQETRQIKSLSPEDVVELKRGGGWGLAKAAELNGVPGPIHLLELKDKIGLTVDQVREITKLYEEMKGQAITAGKTYLALEKQLDKKFRGRSIEATELKQLLKKIAEARSALRFVHLSTHLKARPIVTPQQVVLYNKLRGYGSDPCASVPAGHDVKMWRKHNGCK